MVFSSYVTVEKNHTVELHKNTWQELYSNRRKLIFYTVLESICDEFCAKSHAPRWNTLDAIEVLVRPCTQPFHSWPLWTLLVHLGLLWGPKWTTYGFYWHFPMVLGTLSTLKVEAVVFGGQQLPKFGSRWPISI